MPRIAWLLNHKALHECEVPMLRSMGYEIFTSKIIPKSEPLGVVYREDDSSLSIPLEDLQVLNQHSFYTQHMTRAILDILNNYFDLVIAAGYPTILDGLIKGYVGDIIIRVFGRATNGNYTALFKRNVGEMVKIRHRFWMGAAYKEILDVEEEPLKSMTTILPIGLPKHVMGLQGTWVGSDKRTFIVCPYINSKRYYRVRYDWMRPIRSMPHRIGGVQPIRVKDPNVTGYLDDRRYYGLMKASKAMFYYGMEPRHMHYHPIEGIIIGIPLIFMKKSLLGSLMGSRQPGGCRTLAEAKSKLEDILSGNESLINNITCKQSTILERFSDEAVKRQWKEFLCTLNHAE